MVTLIAYFGSTILISAVARLLGASKKVAVLLALIPWAIYEFFFSLSLMTLVDSHGRRIPEWKLFLAGIAPPVVLAVITAILVRKRQPNHSPEATAGQRPPANPGPSAGAPHL